MARYDFRTQRLFVPDDLANSASVNLDPGRAHYLVNVLRLRSGDEILVFNGRDGEWSARVAAAGRKACTLAIGQPTRPQPFPGDLHYLFTPLKQARLDYLVQKAVEMGASVLRPVLSDHTQVRRVNLKRMHANIIEAAEQCGILAIPQLRDPQKLQQVVDGWSVSDGARRLVFCDEDQELSNPIDVLRAVSPGTLGVLVGPEGGFSRAERELLLARDFTIPISLGPRILRADTAAVAALAVAQAALGDWRPHSLKAPTKLTGK